MRPTNTLDILGNPTIQGFARFNQMKEKLAEGIAQQLSATKTYADMSSNERKVCVSALVAQSSTEEELRAKLCELGMEYFEVNWSESNPEDQTSMEAQLLVRALGGLISNSGALVMIMTLDDMF